MATKSRYPLELMGFACKWSPFNPELLAVTQTDHFGFIGRGLCQVYHIPQQTSSTSSSSSPQVIASRSSDQSIYDVAWSEKDNQVLAYTTVNGEVVLWDVLQNKNLHTFLEHTQECYSISWNALSTQHFLSGSWDNTMKLYDSTHLLSSVQTFADTASVNVVHWSPQYSDMFVAGGLAEHVSIWDVNSPSKPVLKIHLAGAEVTGGSPAHRATGANVMEKSMEVNTLAFDKFNANLLYCGLNDGNIHIYDIRNVKSPVITLSGHELGVKLITPSPHQSGLFLSSSYDMSIGIWDMSTNITNKQATSTTSPYLVGKYDDHSEFIFGVSINPVYPSTVASVSFDQCLDIWDIQQCISGFAPA